MLQFFKWDLCIPTASTFFECFIEFIANEDDYSMNVSTEYLNLSGMKRYLAKTAVQFLNLSLNGEW